MSRRGDDERTDATIRQYDQPGTYEIRVKGHLDARWAAWFEGLTLGHDSDGTTSLRGQVADQAALHGVLQKVRDLGLELVSVMRLAS